MNIVAFCFYNFYYLLCNFVAPDMSVKFIRAALKSASRLENWYVLNFGPWFTRQPIVLRRIGAHLVQVDYCHTAHFVAFPRRAIRSTLRDYAKLINSGNCVPFDDWFGKYGNVSPHVLLNPDNV